MISLIASIGALMVGVGLLTLATGLLGTFSALRATIEGFDSTLAGMLMSAYYVGLIIGTFRCGALIRRIGHIRAFAAFCAMAGALVCLMPFVIHPWSWLFLRAAIGFNVAGMFMVVESWLNARATSETRGTVMSVYMMVSYLAVGSGQLLMNLGDPRGMDLFVIAVMLFTLALVPVAVTRTRAPEPQDSSAFGPRQLFEISPLSVIGCLGAGLLAGAVYGMGPIFGRSLGMSVSEIALFMSVLVTSGLVLQLPIGRASDRFDRRRVLTLVAAGCAVVALAIAALMMWRSLGDALTVHPQASFWFEYGRPFLVLAALYGGLSATLYPLSVAYANDYIEARDMVPATAGLVLAFGVGAAGGPVGAALTMKLLGPMGLFVFIAVVATGVVAFALYRMRRRHWVPVMEKEAYVGMPDATIVPVAAPEMDPRSLDTTGQQLELELSDVRPVAAEDPGR